MNWIEGIQSAIDYIEAHLCEKIDYGKVAGAACSSSYHFQRVFGIMCGITLGEYIRRRRLTLAGKELTEGRKVTEVALKYGYDTPESFSRAFFKFHGMMPSRVKQGCALNSYSRLRLKIDLIGGTEMKYKLTEMPKRTLVGFKQHFGGVPYSREGAEQTARFYMTTRGKQWLLTGASCDHASEYAVITNMTDEGYDFYIAYELDRWTMEHLFDASVTGMPEISALGLEQLDLPSAVCAVFETRRCKRPVPEYEEMARRVITEWLPSSGYRLANAPLVTVLHWRPVGAAEKERYIEICLPVEKNVGSE